MRIYIFLSLVIFSNYLSSSVRSDEELTGRNGVEAAKIAMRLGGALPWGTDPVPLAIQKVINFSSNGVYIYPSTSTGGSAAGGKDLGVELGYSGVFVSPTHILTSGRAVELEGRDGLMVQHAGNAYKVKAIQFHPDYIPSPSRVENITFTLTDDNKVSAVCGGRKLALSEWGKTDYSKLKNFLGKAVDVGCNLALLELEEVVPNLITPTLVSLPRDFNGYAVSVGAGIVYINGEPSQVFRIEGKREQNVQRYTNSDYRHVVSVKVVDGIATYDVRAHGNLTCFIPHAGMKKTEGMPSTADIGGALGIEINNDSCYGLAGIYSRTLSVAAEEITNQYFRRLLEGATKKVFCEWTVFTPEIIDWINSKINNQVLPTDPLEASVNPDDDMPPLVDDKTY